jgi:hypothetical protein
MEVLALASLFWRRTR